VLIPAAGKGTRSNLPYPKTLLKINRKTILERIINKVEFLDKSPSIIVSNKGINLIHNYLKTKRINSELILQNRIKGMGNAILQFQKSKYFNKSDHILLIWGDIPFIRKSSIKKLINFHKKNENSMTILSAYTKNPYTYISRDRKGKIIEIIETKNIKKVFNYGERDIGVFIFDKKLIFRYLKRKYKEKYSPNNEHNFLYIIKYLAKSNYKIESLPIANKKEMKSLNYLKDLN